MKQIITLLCFIITGMSVFAQTDTATAAPVVPADTVPVPTVTPEPPAVSKKKDWSKVSVANRSNDHLMIQIGYDGWAGKPDSINTKGIPRSFNIYFMMDFPFKTDPRFSVALGVGISSGSMYFDKTTVAVAGPGTVLNFRNVADTNYYKKYKLATTYAEIPLELRFTANPEHNGRSWKFALGGKIGTMLNAHTKGKNLLNKSGGTLNSYTVKETSKRFFNSTRLAATARIGVGVFSVFGAYQINNFLKDGAGPEIRPYSIGIAFSGL